MNPLGISLWNQTDALGPDCLGLPTKIAETGFDAVEIPMTQPGLSEPLTEKIRGTGLRVSPCAAMSPGRDLSSFDPQVRTNTMEHLTECLEAGAKLGTDVFAGPLYAGGGKSHLLPLGEVGHEWGLAVQGLRALNAHAREYGVCLTIEPFSRYRSSVVDTAKRALCMVSDVDDNFLGIHFDTSHTGTEEEDLCGTVERALAAGKMFHLRVCANHHDAPGQELFSWEQIFGLLRSRDYQGHVTMEAFKPGGLDSGWVQLGESPDALALVGFRCLIGAFREKQAIQKQYASSFLNGPMWPYITNDYIESFAYRMKERMDQVASYGKFHFQSIEELKERITELRANIHLSEDLSPLAHPVKVGSKTSPNTVTVLPMESCDSKPDGSPSELVERRYTRFAEGGAGPLWWKTCAVVQEGRANPLRTMLTKENVGKFAGLLRETNAAATAANGADHRPLNIVQLTHSGRYFRPGDHKGAPLIPQHDSLFDPRVGLGLDAPVITDEYLDAFTGKYVWSTLLAKETSFDGIDIKGCHRYLPSELLASHTREGKYDGSFENKTRFLRQTIHAVHETVGDDFLIACRFNVFDAHPYPYGFGAGREDVWKLDPTEPMMLVKMLMEDGVGLLSNSTGSPYYIYPQMTRPFDQSNTGIPVPDERPLKSVSRLLDSTRCIQEVAGDVSVISNGYTQLHQYAPYAGAASIADRSCSFMDLGRSSFACPEAPHGILTKGEMDPKQYCITCSKCAQIMRDHGHTGCVIKDSKLCAPLYREAREKAQQHEHSFQ